MAEKKAFKMVCSDMVNLGYVSNFEWVRHHIKKNKEWGSGRILLKQGEVQIKKKLVCRVKGLPQS